MEAPPGGSTGRPVFVTPPGGAVAGASPADADGDGFGRPHRDSSSLSPVHTLPAAGSRGPGLGAGRAQPSHEWEAVRWARVLGLLSVMICTVGLQYAYGLLLVAFQAALPAASFAVLVSVGSLSNGVMELSAVATGAVMLRWGERRTCVCGGLLAGLGLLLSSFATRAWHLVVAHGLVVGFGNSLSLFPAVITLNKVFSRRRSLAAGIGCSGGGLGTLGFGVCIPRLLEGFGLAWTLRILAAIVAVLCCAAGLILTDPFPELHPTRRDQGHRNDGGSAVAGAAEGLSQSSHWWDATRSWKVRVCCAGLFVASCGLFTPIVTLVEFAVQNGWRLEDGSWLVGFVGVGGLTFRVPVSAAADLTGPRRAILAILYLDGILLACAGSGVLVDFFPVMIAYSVSFGGLLGCFLTITAPMMAALAEDAHMTHVTTLAFTCVGSGFMAGPAVLVAVFPENLKHAVLSSGILVILGAAVVHSVSLICMAPGTAGSVPDAGMPSPDPGATQLLGLPS